MSFNPFQPFRAFGGGAVLSLDPDAAAYIAALETAGATVSPTQSAAIDAFIVAEKAGSRWDLIKRLYLPIWAAATPNAICMRSLTSGTFFGSVTYGAGFVAATNASSGMDLNVTPSALGLTTATGWAGVLIKTASSVPHQYLAVQKSIVEQMRIRTSATDVISEYCNQSAGRLSTTATRNGILSLRRFGGVLAHHRRSASGRNVLATVTQADQGVIPSINLYAMCQNFDGTAQNGGTSEMSSWWIGTGVTDAQDADFTLNLKTLWETCTGLILP